MLNEQMKIATEETFGPVAPIFIFKTEEEVITKANNTNYGLAFIVYQRFSQSLPGDGSVRIRYCRDK